MVLENLGLEISNTVQVHYDLPMFANLLRASIGVEMPEFLLFGKVNLKDPNER
jgi:hypothetical protein